MLLSYSKERRVDESSSVMFAGRDGRPPMQSIIGDNDGTYTSYMVPFVTDMLGLPCRSCWGPQQLIAGDY